MGIKLFKMGFGGFLKQMNEGLGRRFYLQHTHIGHFIISTIR